MSKDFVAEAAARADEPLEPALAAYVEDGMFGPALRHPLVYEIPMFPGMAWRSNDQYHGKMEALDEARASHDWHSYIWLHERPYRAEALWHIRKRLEGRAYWELLRQVWTDSENIWQWGRQRPRWLLRRSEPGREYLMDEDERAALAAMPEVLTIYRGYHRPRGTLQSWSWTLDRDKAVWFARRLLRGGESPVLATAKVRKADVTAYLTTRNEEEIVADPRKIISLSAEEVHNDQAA